MVGLIKSGEASVMICMLLVIMATLPHYNGTTWTKIESGTTLNIYDIWGDMNPYTNEYEIIALASNIFQNQGNKLLQIRNNQAQELNNIGLPWGLLTVWFVPERLYYVGGDGLYTIKQLGNDWVQDSSIPAYFKFEQGQSLNDIVLSGSYGLFMHFNGIEWKNYQFNVVSYNDFFSSIDLKFYKYIDFFNSLGGSFDFIFISDLLNNRCS